MPTEADEHEFFAAVGKAITRWADLEELLFHITNSILGCTREQAAIVFYRESGMGRRLQLTTELIGTFFPPQSKHPDPGLVRWREIRDDISCRLKVRNGLAHHLVGPRTEIVISPDGDADVRVAQESYITSTERREKREKALSYGLDEVREHAIEVSRLINDLRNFRNTYLPPTVSGRGITAGIV
jgi:hypothetical protein